MFISNFTDSVLTHEIGDTEVNYVVRNYESWKRQQSFVGELEVMERFAEDVSDSDVVWDVGANVGTYTCLAGKAADDVRVYAFEPLPQNIEILNENIGLNNIDVKIISKALSDTSGEMGFKSPSSGAGGDYSLTEDPATMTIETSTGDSLVDRGDVDVPSIAKIDVEGAEVRVLEGVIETIESIDTLYIEVHPERIVGQGQTVGRLEEILRNAGFNYERIHDRGSEYFIRAVK